MKNIISILLIIQISIFAGVFTKYGYVNIKTWNGINLYIDGQYRGIVGEGVTKIKLSEGNHKIKVSGDSMDGDWHYEIEKIIYIGEDMEITTTILPQSYPTEQRKQKIKKAKEEQLRIAKKRAAKTKLQGKYYKADIDNLILNITSAKGKEKLMKLSLSIRSTEPKIQDIIKSNKEDIIDAIIGQISARTSEELLTVWGKAVLKEEMLEELNAIINESTASDTSIKRNNIKKLFYTDFIIK